MVESENGVFACSSVPLQGRLRPVHPGFTEGAALGRAEALKTLLSFLKGVNAQ